MFSKRFSSYLAIVSLISGLGALPTGCDQGPTGPNHFSILSPGESHVTVLPGETVHFQVQLNATGFRVEYEVDDELVQEGPSFDFTPLLVEHRIRISVISVASTAAPDVREFTVGVGVPGNAPPEVSSFNHVPETAEAVTDTFTFSLSALDPDGTVDRVRIDFGDGTNPLTLTSGGQVQVEHVFPAQGAYMVRAIVFDDDEVAVDARDTVVALPPNQFPTGSLTLQGATEGNAPLVIAIRTSGSDADGQIVKWELDTDQGDGFQEIQPNETVQVSYAFREDTYLPKLRLTDDDGDATVIEADDEILVFRQVSAGESNVTFKSNPAFAAIPILHPAIWADGQDAFTVMVDVRGPEGSPVPDVPVVVDASRPSLTAPDGRNLGVPISVTPAVPRTNAQGRVVFLVRTNTSTRVESAPDLGFVPFALEIQADRGHGKMVVLDRIEDLNAETIITERDGTLTIQAASGNGYCPGELVNMVVQVDVRAGAPGAGQPAANRFTVLRRGQFSDPALIPVTPAAGFTSWRTDGSGRIVLQFRPKAEDQGRIVVAWVDGQPLLDLKAFNFAPNCP